MLQLMCDYISAASVESAAAMPICDVRCKCAMQGSLLDNQELLESLNQAKAKAATINASLQESCNLQVSPCTLQTIPRVPTSVVHIGTNIWMS